jgi:DNA-3-methyladenine glycosylase I
MPQKEKIRCSWAGSDPLYCQYHDEEWGVPNYDSRALWEMLMLEGFQAGLAWIIILRKREAFRKAFKNFDPTKVARFSEADITRLLADPGIVRARAKIEATIAGAQIYLEMQKSGEFRRRQADPEHRPRACANSTFRGNLEGAQEARLQIRRPHYRLRLDAGRRHGQ